MRRKNTEPRRQSKFNINRLSTVLEKYEITNIKKIIKSDRAELYNTMNYITDILESGEHESIDIEISPELKLKVLSSILSESNVLEGFIKK